MTHYTLLPHKLFCRVSLIVITLSFSSLAYGAPQRTFVSAQRGNDSNMSAGCSITLPCRDFNAAMSVVDLGGEVVALDSGGYNRIFITKAVSLTAPAGVYVGITALTPTSSAIMVSASTATVVLRGLTLTGLGGLFGIWAFSVANLHVESCVISGFEGNGIDVDLQVDGSHIFVKDTIIRNNIGSGIEMRTSRGMVSASIDNCRAERNGRYGFFANYNSRVTINRSVASGNTGAGFIALSRDGATRTEMACDDCVASNNDEGYTSFAFNLGRASIRVSHSTATNNSTYGFNQGGTGVFESLGNNLVRANGAVDTLGTITVIAAQ